LGFRKKKKRVRISGPLIPLGEGGGGKYGKKRKVYGKTVQKGGRKRDRLSKEGGMRRKALLLKREGEQ